MLHSLLDYYYVSQSERTMEILAGVREPHDKVTMCDKRLKVLPSADLHSLPYSEDSIDLRCFEAYLMERVMSYRNILSFRAKSNFLRNISAFEIIGGEIFGH